jgi:two-component system, cell cycle response regulator DivK
MKTVLVIEDDDNNMTLISDLIAYAGYRVLGACTGAEGLRLAAKEAPDLIVLDIKLPDMDGEEVLRILQQRAGHGLPPVVAMTSYAMTGDIERLFAAGCSGYIEKPIDVGRVILQLNALLEDKEGAG